MFRLLEITLTDKETSAIYDNFADETALTAEFDTKMGAAMKADAYKAELLIAFDNTGKIYAQGFTSKGDEYTLSPRLIWVTATNEGETANQSKKDSVEILEADFYSKRGSAKKNADVLAILNLGVDGKSVVINDYWVRSIEPEK